MASVSITEIKPGLKLSKDAYTPLGGLLLQKGTVILPRDLEILHAFMVQSVEIDNGEQETKNSGDTSKTAGPLRSIAPSQTEKKDSGIMVLRPSFQEEYEKMIQLVKSTYSSVIAAGLPIYELRSQLEALISQVKDYNLMTFSPRTMNEYDYIYHHAVLCALSSYQLARWIGLQQKDWMQAALAGLFHDIGNIKIDPAVLHKPQPLTAEEAEEMRRHTTYGYQLLKNVTAINEGVRLAALQHHEKVDGSGYPLRLDGAKIHTYAKIVGIVDIFHAMTLNRIYQKAQSPYLVLEQIHSEAFGKLDPGIVRTLINKVTEFHNGIVVRLSNDQIGEIVFTDRNHPTRPMVSVNGQIINLIQQRQLFINEIISS